MSASPATPANRWRRFVPWTVVLLGFCAFMTTLLVRREYGAPSADLVVDSALRLEEPIETWLGFFAGEPSTETQVGAARLLQRPETRAGLDGSTTELELDIRGKRQPCSVTELPFYSRTRKKKTS